MISQRLPTPLVCALARPVGAALDWPLPYPVPRLALAAGGWALGARVRGRVEQTQVGGIPGERIGAADGKPTRTLLYLHGGGWVMGSPLHCRRLAVRLVDLLEADAFVPAYRLAPEHPYPAALDDALAAYRGLLATAEAGHQFVLAGESAGGNLALALALAIRDTGLPEPAAVAMICPALDITPQAHADRRIHGRRKTLPRTRSIERWAAAYAAATDPATPTISPLLADLRGLPPLIVQSAGDDPLLTDAERLQAAATTAGTPIIHRRHPGSPICSHPPTGPSTHSAPICRPCSAPTPRRPAPTLCAWNA